MPGKNKNLSKLLCPNALSDNGNSNDGRQLNTIMQRKNEVNNLVRRIDSALRKKENTGYHQL